MPGYVLSFGRLVDCPIGERYCPKQNIHLLDNPQGTINNMASSLAVLVALWHTSIQRDEDMFKKPALFTITALCLVIVATIAYAIGVEQIGNLANSLAALSLILNEIRREPNRDSKD